LSLCLLEKQQHLMRTNTQITLSFGQDEKELLEILDEQRKKEHISRSGWVKNQIRKEYGNQTANYLTALY
tara:strand:- start:380 stop:589 length:210 start_codon:yes stop_codon:yes gene_type:complete